MKRTNPPTKKLIILTNDPSITAWGYVVLDKDDNILSTGCIKTEPQQKKRRIRVGDDIVRRVSEINYVLLRIIRHYGVAYLISELPHGSKNASAAKMIGLVTGIIQTISDCLEIGVEWYSENDAKKCAVGKNSATKKEIIDAMDSIYDVPWKGVKYKDEAIADALAIHHVASKQSSTLQLFKTMK